jgi:hypothetical protein
MLGDGILRAGALAGAVLAIAAVLALAGRGAHRGWRAVKRLADLADLLEAAPKRLGDAERLAGEAYAVAVSAHERIEYFHGRAPYSSRAYIVPTQPPPLAARDGGQHRAGERAR